MNAQQIRNKNLLSSFFITLLITSAYGEMTLSIKDAIQTDAFNLEIMFLPAVFFFVSVRFFVGNQLHLLDDSLAKLPGLVWLYDLMVIICQCIILFLLGGLTSAEGNRSVPITFLDLLILLYVIDVLWIVSQWALKKVFRSWNREFIPWAWAILNSVLIGLFFLLDFVFADVISSRIGLISLLLLSVLGFVVDVVLIDYYDVL